MYSKSSAMAVSLPCFDGSGAPPSRLTEWRHIRQQEAESLRHRQVRQNGVAEFHIRHPGQHRGLHRGHDLTGLGADHGETEDAVVTPTTSTFMKPGRSPSACTRSTPLIGNFATRGVTPWRRASASLSPTCASGGSVK